MPNVTPLPPRGSTGSRRSASTDLMLIARSIGVLAQSIGRSDLSPDVRASVLSNLVTAASSLRDAALTIRASTCQPSPLRETDA